ncbi:S-layer homology domain-containing protein [Butyricicoccus pullicaecorum]|nr:S-layer homology domain-containing protein [Butyricicoccus pullicaecorum]
MKNLKKVLALVLAFACAFTMFAGAVVYPDVPAGSEYSEAITMLSDLGIIQGKDDGKYHSEDTITRAEACALIARMLTGDPQVSQYAGASNFTDVVKGSWKESVVGYCVVNGITVGVGNNKFEPDRAITDAEFVTMVVRAMGYETTGTSYPYGHISAAQANGLLDDVTVVPSSAALRGEDAQIIYNALFADYARGAKRVNTTHGTTVEEYPTIAEDVFGLTRAAVGTADKDGNLKNCKAHTWVVTGKLCVKGYTDKVVAYAITDDKSDLYDETPYLFTYEGDVDALVGYQVELWGEGVHGQDEYKSTKIDGDKYVVSDEWDVKAIKTLKGQTSYEYTPADDDLPDTDFDDVKLFKESKESKVKDALKTKNSAQYNLIDWDSDGDVDYIDDSITSYYEVAYATSKKVQLNGFDGKKAYTLDTDGETEIEDDVFVKAELPKDLEEGDVVAVTKSCVSSKKNVVSTWTVEVVEPKTKEVTEVSTKKGVYFDDEKIDVAAEAYTFGTTYADYKKLDEKSDYDYDLWLDANGFIIKMKEADESYTGFLFVTGLAEGANKTGDRNLMVVSGKNDKNEVFEDVKVSKDAEIEVWDNGKYVDIFKDNAIADKGNGTGDNDVRVVGQAFKYKMNDDEKIVKLHQVAVADIADYHYDADKEAVFNNYTGGKWDAKNYLDKADVIFAVRTGTDYWTSNKVNKNIVKELDVDDVMAVELADIPDINTYDNANNGDTKAMGLQRDLDGNKSSIDAAVLGVDTFKYFGNTSTNVALVTGMTYNPKGDYYKVEGVFSNSDETVIETVDQDDVELNSSSAAVTKLGKLEDIIEKGNTAKHGVYCEIETNKDGKIIAITVLDQNVANTDWMNNNAKSDLKVYRGVVTNISGKDVMSMQYAKVAGEEVESIGNAAVSDEDFDLEDKTVYYKLTEDVVMADGKYMNAYRDGFDKDFDVKDIEDGDKSELESWIENNYVRDDYVVADVVVDKDDDVVAVYYYEDTVAEEVKNLFTGVNPTAATYAAGDAVTVSAALTEANLRGDVTIKLQKKDENGDYVTVATKVATKSATTNDFRATFTNVEAGDYKAVASAENAVDRKEDTAASGDFSVAKKFEIVGTRVVDSKNMDIELTTALPTNATVEVKWSMGAASGTNTATIAPKTSFDGKHMCVVTLTDNGSFLFNGQMKITIKDSSRNELDYVVVDCNA